MQEPYASIIRRPLTVACWRETAYLIVILPTGIAGFTIVVAGWSVALGLLFMVVGLPMAAGLAHFDRFWCSGERRLAGWVLRREVPGREPPATGGRLVRWLSILRQGQTWVDALWMLLGLPLGIAGFTVAVTAWTTVGALAVAPIFGWSIPGWVHSNDVWLSIIAPFVSIPAAIAVAWLVRGLALAHASLAAWMLGLNRAQVLEQRVQTLAETRADAVDQSVTDLQRVERDLHDGAQARLVALAMDLGMAEQRLAQADPDSAKEHVAAARGQARQALAELRDLVRGIGPSILTDRGLDAALTALISGQGPAVDLQVELSSTDVTARETAAYFVVAEALTNVRKHAQANRVGVHVWEDAGGRLIAEVTDDGVGGADPDSGSGLPGLRKRIAALDGTLTVVSPSGGPTTVRAELPCAS